MPAAGNATLSSSEVMSVNVWLTWTFPPGARRRDRRLRHPGRERLRRDLPTGRQDIHDPVHAVCPLQEDPPHPRLPTLSRRVRVRAGQTADRGSGDDVRWEEWRR